MSILPPAEVEVTRTLVEKLLRAQFAELELRSICRIGEGWDTTVWLVNDTLAFKFPRREVGAECVEFEIASLPEFSATLSLPVPIISHFGVPSADFKWPFFGYRLVPGRMVTEIDLSEKERHRLGRPLGRFAREVHQVRPRKNTRIPGDNYQRVNIEQRLPNVLQRMQEAKRQQLLPDSNFEHIIQPALNASKTDATPLRLVHGDLYARHILVGDSHELSGVIDWGDVHIGHPAIDVSIAYILLNAQGRIDFFAEYGAIPQTMDAIARFRALGHSIMCLLYAHEIHDTGLFRESQFALTQLTSLK